MDPARQLPCPPEVHGGPMLFTGLVWFWKNALEAPLKALGKPGQLLSRVLYPLLVYLPGMSLAFLAFLLYPPKVIAREPLEGPPGGRRIR